MTRIRTSTGFNPHPPLLAGETPARLNADGDEVVSIHTRHYWRVKPGHVAPPAHRKRFNPHPPLLAGETVQRITRRVCCVVSIHTRHYWRVKLGQPIKQAHWAFQSTPAITGG